MNYEIISKRWLVQEEGEGIIIIGNFLHFYRIWRKRSSRWGAIKCAWTLTWMHRKIDKKMKKLGPKEYAKQIIAELKEKQQWPK